MALQFDQHTVQTYHESASCQAVLGSHESVSRLVNTVSQPGQSSDLLIPLEAWEVGVGRLGGHLIEVVKIIATTGL